MQKLTVVASLLLLFSCIENEVVSPPTSPIEVESSLERSKASPVVGTLSITPSYYYLFLRGQSSPTVRYVRSSDGVNWESEVLLPGKSSTGPTAVYYNGKIFTAFKGETKASIFAFSSSDGTTWTSTEIGGTATTTSPGMCVYNGQVYIFYVDSNFNVPMYTKSSNGVTWSTPAPLCGDGCFWTSYHTSYGDVYAVSPYEIYFLARFANNQNEIVIVRTDYTFSYTEVVTRFNSTSPCTNEEETDVGISVANNIIAIKGKDTGYIFIGRRESCGYTVTQLNVKTSSRPSLTYKNGKYMLTFKGYSSALIYTYESTDGGVTWTNLRTISPLETVAAPYMMVNY